MAKTLGYFSNKDFNTLSLLEDMQANFSWKSNLGEKEITITNEPNVHLYTDSTGRIIPVTSALTLSDQAAKDLGNRVDHMGPETVFLGDLGQHIESVNPSLIKKEMGYSFDQIMSSLANINSHEKPTDAFEKSEIGKAISKAKIRESLAKRLSGGSSGGKFRSKLSL